MGADGPDVFVGGQGGWVPLPGALVFAAWLVGGASLWLVWDSHRHEQTQRANRNRHIELILKLGLTLFYLGLGGGWLATGEAPAWLAAKALLFGAIFAAAIIIDIAFKPIGPQLDRLIAEESSGATEVPLLATLHRTRL